MMGREILDVRSYHFERAISFILDQDLLLLFKLFGNFSNMLLFEKSKCIDIFKHNLNDEDKINPEKLDRGIEINEENFSKAGYRPEKMIPAIDTAIKGLLEKRGFNTGDQEGKWDLLKKVLQELEAPSYYITSVQDEVKFRLFPEGKILQRSMDPIAAITTFYYEHQRNHWLSQEKTKLLKILHQQLKKQEQYIHKSEKKQAEWMSHLDYRQKADIIMANLHHIKPHRQEIELFDFYHNQPVTIRLNPHLSPQKNAEQFYRKAKNQQKEVAMLENNITRKKKSAALLQKVIGEIGMASDLKTLKSLNEKYQIDVESDKKHVTERFKSFEHMGFRILVGRNAKNNEELTFEYGYKDDLWLHAKDVSGSHVLIKYQAGKSFPRPVIEKAGQLAAYYSKNRHSTVCPVIYTEKKYVRKLKGAPPGTVRVEKESILFSNPADQS
jgi:predicted ribosome quality control (RQC) complex YloA/Tae2 family protein